MTRRITILPQVEFDVSDAAAWYEEQRTELGDSFLDEIDSILHRIINDPLQFPRIKIQIRRALMRRFPYSVYFGLSGETVELLAVLHQHERDLTARAVYPA